MRWLATFPEDRPSVPHYIAWAARGGVVLDVRKQADPLPDSLDSFAALLLPGGGDVDPARYQAAGRHPETYGVDVAQDERELDLIRRFEAARRPIFGICRGLQVLNVAFGGGLIQHLPDHVAEETERHRKRGTYDALHPLVWAADTRLGGRLGAARFANSAHHQAIDPRALGRGLRVAARSPEGVIEAVERFDAGAPVVAVQWHPERLADDEPASRGLREFLLSLM